MMRFVVLAVYLAVRDGPVASRGRAGASLVTEALIKASAAVLIPVFLLACARRRFLAGCLLAAAVLGTAGMIAFGAHLPDLFTQSRLVTAIGIPELAGLALGQGGETATVQVVVSVLVALAILACSLWAVRRPREWLTTAGVAALALVISLSWAAPWYILWILPFAALSTARRLRGAVVVLGAYFVLALMPAAVMFWSDLDFRPASTPLGILHTRQRDAAVR